MQNSCAAGIITMPLPKFFRQDPYLAPHADAYSARKKFITARRKAILAGAASLLDITDWHEKYGLHRLPDGNWHFREWLPNAASAMLLGSFNNWSASEWFELQPAGNGDWELFLPAEMIKHGDVYQLYVEWQGGKGWRLPTAVTSVTREQQSDGHYVFNAQVWAPPKPFRWKHDSRQLPKNPLIYEAHIGIAQEEPRTGTFAEFTKNVLPRIAAGGYNTLQLMAIAEHPYYASFGYHVSNFFAVEERFGSPDDFKALVDAAHGLGLAVIMDLVHSHSVKNELEGLGNLCGERAQFFHDGPRGVHSAWDSYCFDYSKPQVARMLLSNCRYWLEEYHLDGFRFDGVTSMLYFDHGLGRAFTSYDDYFGPNVDWDSVAYLTLANELCHSLGRPVMTIAEDVSGMPGLAVPVKQGGIGFDYRLAMGVTDYWFKLLDQPDEWWDIGRLWQELTNRRQEEKTISYVECHDQAIVGGQTFIFRSIGNAMYDAMHTDSHNDLVDRGIALHKLSRLATVATAGAGYMNFIGNEFGHPEWLDLPREGNSWSYDHARRRWDLADNPALRFRFLNDFDREMLAVINAHPHFFDAPAIQRWLDPDKHILIFERDGLLFAFNFHPTQSWTDFPVPAGKRSWKLLFDTDAPRFNGFGRVQPGQEFFPCCGDADAPAIELYLPTRTALVLV